MTCCTICYEIIPEENSLTILSSSSTILTEQEEDQPQLQQEDLLNQSLKRWNNCKSNSKYQFCNSCIFQYLQVCISSSLFLFIPSFLFLFVTSFSNLKSFNRLQFLNQN